MRVASRKPHPSGGVFIFWGVRAIPYTSNKRLSVQAAASNSGTWGAGGVAGDDLNTGVMGLIDTQFAGVAAFSVSSSNVSLSYSNIQQAMFRFTGTLTADIVASPAVGDATTYFNGFYYFENLTAGAFTITLQNGSGSVVLPQGRRGVVFASTVASLAPRIMSLVGSSVADPIPAGSKAIWYNASAPSGWTAVVLNDYAIKIVTNGGGGVTSGSVAYSTLFARTATDSHTLTLSQIPSHAHSSTVASTLAGSKFLGSGSLAGDVTTPTGSAGGGNGHTHDLDMRVLTAAFVLATRD